MRKIVFLFIALVSTILWAKPDKYSQLATIAGRARCISRVATPDGKIIETWKKGNYIWANTNAVVRVISSVRQTNTFEEKLEKLRDNVTSLTESNTGLSSRIEKIKTKAKGLKDNASDKKNKYKNNGNNGNGNIKKIYAKIQADLEDLISILDAILEEVE